MSMLNIPNYAIEPLSTQSLKKALSFREVVNLHFFTIFFLRDVSCCVRYIFKADKINNILLKSRSITP